MNSRIVSTIVLVTLSVVSARAELIPVGEELQVNTGTTGAQWAGTAAPTLDGGFVVVFTTTPTESVEDAGLLGQRYDAAGEPVGAEFPINTSIGYVVWPDVASSGQGGLLVVWESYEEGAVNPRLLARRLDVQGAPVGPELELPTADNYFIRASRVAGDALGNFVVVWRDLGQDGLPGIFGQRYNATGEELAAIFQINDPRPDAVLGPADVGTDGQGNFLVVWSDVEYRVWGRWYDAAGMPMGLGFELVEPLAAFPRVTVAENGSFVLAWNDIDEDWTMHLVAQRYGASGEPQGDELEINLAGRNPRVAGVAHHGAGNFLVVWQFDSWIIDGGTPGPEAGDVFGRYYDAEGNPIGGDFRINTRPAELPPFLGPRARVIASSAGEFLVVWTSQGVDGDGYGVAAQRWRNDESLVPPTLLLDYTDRRQGSTVSSVEQAHELCRDRFGDGWRWLPFHEQGGWGVVGAWRRGAPEDRGWAWIDDQRAECFSSPQGRGMTWHGFQGAGGRGARCNTTQGCNPYRGDTLCSESRPLFCAISTTPLRLASSRPLAGNKIGGVESANRTCRLSLGKGWRWLEAHEQRGDQILGQWLDGTPPGMRGWVWIDDAQAECHSPSTGAGLTFSAIAEGADCDGCDLEHGDRACSESGPLFCVAD